MFRVPSLRLWFAHVDERDRLGQARKFLWMDRHTGLAGYGATQVLLFADPVSSAAGPTPLPINFLARAAA